VILAAAVLVLVALGLFVGGVATGVTGLYWACVAVSAVAAVLLILARRRLRRAPARRLDEHPEPTAQLPAVEEPAAAPRHEQPADTATGAHAAQPPVTGATEATIAAQPPSAATGGDGEDEEPPVEEVEVTDLLVVVDLSDDVFVIDEHPRYHLADCPFLTGRTAIPLPLDEARTDGFTPCGICAPDRHLAQVERARKASRGTS
jgi:hypothetical protein